MKIKLKALTPIHIGSGEEISPIEYIIINTKEGKICNNFENANRFIRVNMDSLFGDPEFKPLMEKFIESAKEQRYIGELLPEKLLLRHPLYKLEISFIKEKISPITIKSFIKSAGRVFIPGSSLKGSILSGVMYKILKDKKIQRFKSYIEHLGEVLSEISSQPITDNPQFSRWIDVKDSNLKSPEETLELSLTKLVGARTQREMPILYETIKENTEFETEIISHSTKLIEEILKMADEFYRKVYEKEKNFQKQILPQISKDSLLLRIGQGSTAWATSFLILAEELNIKNYTIQRPKFHKITGPPQTRKLITGTKSMGWLEVSHVKT